MDMYSDALKAFKNLENEGVYTFKAVREWSEVYIKLYRIAIASKKYNGFLGPEDFSILTDVSNIFNSDYDIFKELYEKLKFWLDYEKYECYFRVELNEFENIKNDNGEIKKWLKRSEYLMINDLFDVGFEIYEYEEVRSENTEIILKSDSSFKVEIDDRGIENFINFSILYYDLYYSNEYLNDSERI